MHCTYTQCIVDICSYVCKKKKRIVFIPVCTMVKSRRHAGLVCKSTIYYRHDRTECAAILFSFVYSWQCPGPPSTPMLIPNQTNTIRFTFTHSRYSFTNSFSLPYFFPILMVHNLNFLFPCIIFTYLNWQKIYIPNQQWLKDKCQILKMAYPCSWASCDINERVNCLFYGFYRMLSFII